MNFHLIQKANSTGVYFENSYNPEQYPASPLINPGIGSMRNQYLLYEPSSSFQSSAAKLLTEQKEEPKEESVPAVSDSIKASLIQVGEGSKKAKSETVENNDVQKRNGFDNEKILSKFLHPTFNVAKKEGVQKKLSISLPSTTKELKGKGVTKQKNKGPKKVKKSKEEEETVYTKNGNNYWKFGN